MKKAAQATPNRRLSRARELRGWSQQTVADQIGTTPVNISRWERGFTSPSPYFRHKLCTLFGKSAQELGLAPESREDEYDEWVLKPVAQERQEEGFAVSTPSSIPWNIPYRRNSFFTGREAVLRRLHAALRAGKTAALTQTQAISGLGGIGKTQTAVEYAYRYRHEYQALLWARAETRETLVSDFLAIASLLNLPQRNEQDQSRVIEAVKRWLNEHGGWLLILDNVEDLELVGAFLPTTGQGHIVLTTRAQASGTLAQNIELEKMEPEEGALFLLRRTKLIAPDAPLDNASYADWARAKGIAQLMDGLPLALDQAAAYIEETGCGLAGYLERYRTQRAQLLRRRGRLAADHPEPVATTWSLSFAKVEQANAAAAELLKLCGFLHPDAIPEEIITEGAPELGSTLQAVAADQLALDAAIEELRKYSLVKRDPDLKILNIHRLVQAVLKDGLDEEVQRLWAERAVRAVNRVFPEAEFETWQRCQRYLPHAQVCAGLIAQWGMDFPEAAQLLQQAGEYLRKRAQYREAEPFLKQALAMREKTLGTEHPAVAGSLNNLAMLYWDQGRYVEAEPLFRQALTIREKRLGPEHPDAAESLHDLAYLYWIEGKYEQAEPLFLRSLAIREKRLGPEHPDVATNLNNLAVLYMFQGKFAQAESPLQRSLLIRERVLGPAHPDVAESLHDLAYLYYRQGQYRHAEPLFRRALEIRERALGPEHDVLAYTLDNLALVYTELGKYAQAESLFQRALAIREQTLGAGHHYVAQTLTHLALLYLAQHRYAQAEPLLTRSLSIREQVFGPDHPDVAQSLNALARAYAGLDKAAQAEQIALRALKIRERLGPEHPYVAQSLNTLAQVYLAQHKYIQAEPLLQRALAIYEQAFGPDHPHVAHILEAYVSLLRKTDREQEARELEARARAIRATCAQGDQ